MKRLRDMDGWVLRAMVWLANREPLPKREQLHPKCVQEESIKFEAADKKASL